MSSFAAVVLAALDASAATVIVPDDDPSLVHAAAVAQPGDVIQVRPGAYTEANAVRIQADGVSVEGLGGRPVVTGANRKEGFWVDGAAGITIRGVDVLGRRIGIRLDDAPATVVDDVTVADCDRGARVRNSPGTQIVNSRFAGVRRQHGIEISQSSGVQVLGNVVSAPAKEGIRVFKSDGVQLVGNSVSDTGRRGIRLGGSPFCLVVGNFVERSRGAGIAVSGGSASNDCQLLGNLAVDGNREGFEVMAANATLNSNLAMGNGRDGFEIDRTSPLSMDNNSALANEEDGFDVSRCDPLTMTNNNASDNTEYGYRVDDSQPVASPADLLAAGNAASGNLDGDFLVSP